MLVKNTIEKRRARVLKAGANARKTFPNELELRALARSVMKRQLHPVIILPDNIVLDGECRLRGLMLEDPDFEMDVIVVEKELAPGEIGELQLISALHSTSLRPYDQAVAIKEWVQHNPNASMKELADKIDRDSSMLGKLNSLWKTVPIVVKAAEEGKIGVMAWHQISLLPESEQFGLLQLHLAGAPAAQIAAISLAKRRQAASDKPEPKVTKGKFPLTKAKATVQISGDGLTISLVIDLLTDLLKEAKAGQSQGMDIKALTALLVAKAKEKPKVEQP
jgi:hypothetical protein